MHTFIYLHTCIQNNDMYIHAYFLSYTHIYTSGWRGSPPQAKALGNSVDVIGKSSKCM